MVTSLLAAPGARGQDTTSALVNKALDEQAKVAVDAVLPRALSKITNETGVKLDVEPVVWDLLPWGRDTIIKATIDNQTLREALTLMTRKLGLTFVLKDEAIEVQPMPALRRLARRSTVQELQALDLLATNTLGLDTDRPTIKQLLEAVDKKLLDLKSPFAIENRTVDSVGQDKQLAVPRNATLMDALEALPKGSDATWYPWGKTLIVVTKEDRVRAQLQRTVTIRYNGVDVLQVLMELTARCGVRFDFQPGAIQQVHPDARTIRAIFENASVHQILDAVAGSTGLTYQIKQDTVVITNPAVTGAPGPRDPIVGMIQLDNGVQIMLPTSQVPPDVREYLKFRAKKEIEKLRVRMQEEGFVPPTPTTQPARPTAGEATAPVRG